MRSAGVATDRQPRRRRAGRRAALGAVLSGSATLYQRTGERRDRKRYPPPGQLTSVGGRCLHWVDHGGSGVPIMIETGAGSLALGWSDIVDEMAHRGHVYSYDRAGMGWSDPGPARLTPTSTADDLAAVMRSIGEPGPWIIVGHSLGGIYARLFQRRHPELVAGLVLVDSSHEDMLQRIRSEIGVGAIAAQIAVGLGMSAAPRSLLRLVVRTRTADRLIERMAGGSTPEERQRRAALYLTSAFRRAGVSEFVGVPGLLAELRRGDRDLGSLPLAVVTAADPRPEVPPSKTKLRPAWVAMQKDLATLSTRSTHITAATGGHFVHAEDPKAVLAGLDWVIEQARTPAR